MLFFSDVNVSMLLSLLLANIKILSSFFCLFLAVLNNFLTIPVAREKIKLKLAIAIPTGAPKTLAKERIDLLRLLHFEQLRSCPCNQKQ